MKKIVYILTIILSSLVTFPAQTEQLNQLFQNFEKSGGVTSINIKKPMFKLLNTLDINDEYVGKIKPILNEVDGLKLLIIPKITFPDHLKNENLEQIRLNELQTNKVNRALNSLRFNELMSMNSDGVSMKFLAETEKDNYLENLVFNVDSKEENIIFILNGKMKLSDVNKIINSSETTISSSQSSTKSSFVSDNASSYLNGDSRNVGEFSKIDASLGVNVIYKQENVRSVKVLADADKLQYIVTKVEDGVLRIYVDNKGVRNLKFKNLNVNVSAPHINEITTSTGAIFTAVNLVTENTLKINGSSGGVIKGKFNVREAANIDFNSGASASVDVNTPKLTLDTSSGASAVLSGQAESATIDISSGASCKADDLKIGTATAESTSGASLSLFVTDKLKVRASSGAAVRLKGNPELDVKVDKVSGGSFRQVK
ncbi:DUF4252 domain-containing protein [Chryseobacterium indologenes]|uniref:Putative auto-transporter adhesin head GIN domain-containing protein n=1 Tax=Chryseobacterium indologenes TaxID=253 RepID=A0A0N0IUG5_CHRID|nr:DUF4252 domain-containing protein [Chryseobacterium indologenes]KPE49572.1 hypothetical protein AOB46_19585 [Chryseobacterium indologenes]